MLFRSFPWHRSRGTRAYCRRYGARFLLWRVTKHRYVRVNGTNESSCVLLEYAMCIRLHYIQRVLTVNKKRQKMLCDDTAVVYEATRLRRRQQPRRPMSSFSSQEPAGPVDGLPQREQTAQGGSSTAGYGAIGSACYGIVRGSVSRGLLTGGEASARARRIPCPSVVVPSGAARASFLRGI